MDASPARARESLTFSDLLAGRSVLVTGAGRNIGRSVAREMARAGANVYFTDIDREARAKLEGELHRHPIRSQGFLSDVSRPADVERLHEALLRAGVGIDVLVNNAGRMEGASSLPDISLDEWRKTFETNVFGPLHLTRLVAGEMIARGAGGCILFVTSIHQWTVRRIASYSASKAALGMVVKELAVDLAPHGIRVNGIAPGFVAPDAAGRPVRHPRVPLHGRAIDPDYLGRAAVYLAAEHFSRFTTGAVLTIDAGLSLVNHLVEPGRPPS